MECGGVGAGVHGGAGVDGDGRGVRGLLIALTRAGDGVCGGLGGRDGGVAGGGGGGGPGDCDGAVVSAATV